MDKTIFEYAEIWQNGLNASVLSVVEAQKFIIEAAREYQAWGFIGEDNQMLDADGIFHCQQQDITIETRLTLSEWGVIKPLAELFAERENALIQEASRVAGHEVFGRSSSEIAADIQNYRNEYLRKQAFGFPVLSI